MGSRWAQQWAASVPIPKFAHARSTLRISGSRHYREMDFIVNACKAYAGAPAPAFGVTGIQREPPPRARINLGLVILRS
jgi:hypothetical protein